MPTLYCPKCGYNLSNLPEDRCPECGTGFDPKSLLELQLHGVSTRNVVMQLIFVPLGFAAIAPFCILGAAMGDVVGLIIAVVMLLGGILLHSFLLSQAYTRSRRLRDGEDNVPWLYRGVWPCCFMITFVEASLTFMYFAGGCAVILMNMNFH